MGDKNRIIKNASSLGQFHSAIAQICEEKGLDKNSVIATIESALAAAYKKDYGKKGQIIISHIESETGTAKFKQLKEVVDESVRNMEDLEKIEVDKDEFLKEAKNSKEEIESRSAQFLEEDADYLPKFNNDKDVLLEDAQKNNKKIKIGDFLEKNLPSEGDYGRVASQTAKQVIIQRLREAERMAMFEEYKSKEGEIINGSVHRVEGRNVYIDLGKSIGVLYPSEQIPGEYYRIGQRIRVYIKKVEEDSRGSGITLSRTSEGLVGKLFELEVPEIFTKTIEIKAIAREAGNRTKIAVISNDSDIDPIGSCVGQKGTRVQAIIEELGGERIDVIEWDDEIEKLVKSSLSPAKVIKIELKEEDGKALAYVEGDQLSLAIGQKGQNVRLASKLTGWKIDVIEIKKEISKENLDKIAELKKIEEEAEEKGKKEIVDEDKIAEFKPEAIKEKEVESEKPVFVEAMAGETADAGEEILEEQEGLEESAVVEEELEVTEEVKEENSSTEEEKPKKKVPGKKTAKKKKTVIKKKAVAKKKAK